jgi:hypothetical protein
VETPKQSHRSPDTFTEASNTLLDAHVPDIGTSWTKHMQRHSNIHSWCEQGLVAKLPMLPIRVLYILSRQQYPALIMNISRFLQTDDGTDTFDIIGRYEIPLFLLSPLSHRSPQGM